MTDDTDGVKSLFSWSFHRFFLAVFYGFGSIALMVCLCWQLAAVILILSFFEIFCMSKVSVKIQKLSKEIQDGKAGGNNLYSAFLRCLKCIRMLSLHDIMYEKFSRINAEIAKLQTKRGSHIAGINVVNDFFSAVNLLGVLFAGIILYFGGYVDLGSVMAFLVVQDGITYMFNNLKDFFASLQRYLTNIKRVYEVIDHDFAPKDTRHRQAGATDFIMSKEHGFDAMVMERGTGYSGGQRQRIAIARAILSNKSVIVFDEATSALDLESEKMIYAYLQKGAQRGKIVILVSHRESVKAICNRVFRVENGKVNESGRPQS